MRLFAAVSTLLTSLVVIATASAENAIQLSAGATSAPTRMAGNIDSWAALAIVATALISAWAINHYAARVRTVGTLVSALACLSVAAWFFFYILNTGFLENPKPNQTPLDSAKPALLWIQASLSLVAGLFLLLVFKRRLNDSEMLAISAKNATDRYGSVSRFLHWSIAILFLALIPMGIFTSIIPEDTAYRNAYYVVHKTLGVIVFLLLLLRLIWNGLSPKPALESSLKPIERKLAHGVHVALYLMMIALPLTGFIMTSYHGYPTFFFAWEFGPLWAPSDSATIIWGSLHKYLLPYLLYLILGAHILGALKHRFLDKHSEGMKRMLS
tara:strand:- start:369 stop:1349 length:981 start_codon:yes stop_codon:yes gene_type:complete